MPPEVSTGPVIVAIRCAAGVTQVAQNLTGTLVVVRRHVTHLLFEAEREFHKRYAGMHQRK
jgi:hypothetical protein